MTLSLFINLKEVSDMLFHRKKKNDMLVRQEEEIEKLLHTDFEGILSLFSMLVESDPEQAFNFLLFVTRATQYNMLYHNFSHDVLHQSKCFQDVVLKSVCPKIDSDNFLHHKRTISIKNTPIISCPWNILRVQSVFQSINHENILEARSDEYAVLMKPLGLIIVKSGNHRICPALIYNEGEFLINCVANMKDALDHFSFDGKKYVYKQNGTQANIYNLKDNCEPLLKEFGILFEFARILLDNKIDFSEKILSNSKDFIQR